MVYQRLQKRLREARRVDDTLTLASRIWLAGIGALVRAQQEGHEFFDQLVQCGEVVEAVEKDDGLRELRRLARWVLAGPDVEAADAPTSEEIRSLAEAIQNFDPHLPEMELR